MLAIPNDVYGRGVLACFPLEEAAGATAAIDISTGSNAVIALTWKGAWNTNGPGGSAQSSGMAYNPRDVVFVAGTTTRAYVANGPVPVGQLTPGVAATNVDTSYWVLLGNTATYTWIGAWTSGTNYAVNNAVIGPNGLPYRVTTAITNSTTPPATDTGHFTGIFVAYTPAHGMSVPLNATTPKSVAGGTAVVSGAANAWSNPNPTAQAGTVYRNLLYGDPYTPAFGSLFAIFSINTVITGSSQFASMGNMAIGVINSKLIGYVKVLTPGTTSVTTLSIIALEVLQAGTHSIELRYDGYAAYLIMDGDLVGYAIAGFNGPNNSPTPMAAIQNWALGVTGSGSAAGTPGISINNVFMCSYPLNRDIHRSFAKLAGITLSSKFPQRHRMLDSENTASAAAPLASQGCAVCGGDMTTAEQAITEGLSQYHPGCAAINALKPPFGSAATYTQAAQNSAHIAFSAVEMLSTGWQQFHDGTRFNALADTWGGAVGTSNNAYLRAIPSLAMNEAMLARYLHMPKSHWLVKQAANTIDQFTAYQVNTPALAPGLSAQSLSFSVGKAATGFIAPNIQPSTAGTYLANDTSYTTFCLGQIGMTIEALRPYYKRQAPATWARWVKMVESAAESLWSGYSTYNAAIPTSIPTYQYIPNGNWQLNNAYGMLATYRVTRNPIWYQRYMKVMASAINPLIDAQLPSSVLALVGPLGSFPFRGMWAGSTKTYNQGDRVTIPGEYGGAANRRRVTNYAGWWQTGMSYPAGSTVRDPSAMVQGTYTNGSNILTSLSSVDSAVVGKPISGLGVPAGATITAVDTANKTVTMSAASVTAGTGSGYIVFGGNNTPYFYTAAGVNNSTIAPAGDTSNWSADFPGNMQEYICLKNNVQSTTSPVTDTTNWYAVQASANGWYNRGGYGIQGIPGTDSTNWTDYKIWFPELGNSNNFWSPLGGSGVTQPNLELTGMPSYDGDYGMLQIQILEAMLVTAGGINGPHSSVQQAEWQQLIKLLNGYVNQQVQYFNSTTWTIVSGAGAPTYTTRKNYASEGWQGCLYAMAAINAGMRNDLTISQPNLNAGKWLINTATGSFTALGTIQSANFSSNSLESAVGQQLRFMYLDTAAPLL